MFCSYLNMICSSRHKTARPQDIARAVHIIKSLCYPYMVRFLTNIHEMSKYSHCYLHATIITNTKGGIWYIYIKGLQSLPYSTSHDHPPSTESLGSFM